MKLSKVTLGFILPFCLGMVALGAPRPQDEKKPDDNRSAQPDARKQDQQKEKSRPHPQEQPRGKEQPRTQPEPKPQGQQHEHQQARPQEESRAKEQPRTQPQPKPQGQRREQQQARPQEQPKPNENRPPANSNARRQEKERPSQPNENRGAEGGRETAGSRPQRNEQHQARNYAAAKRVPQDQERNIFQQRRASNWGDDHRDWRSRGGYDGFRIPEARFGIYFGRAHYFRLWGLPMVYVGGYPEFQYHGYWFELLDPVPPDWSPDWYETDQVYVDWDSEYGGYYLYDARYPDERLAVEIAS